MVNNDINMVPLDHSIVFDSPKYKESIGHFTRSFLKGFNHFKQTLYYCTSCSIRKEAYQVVLPEGSELSDTIIVGRNPGTQENDYGRPFYPDAPAARILEFYFQAIGIHRNDTYITNACFCHTHRDRVPSDVEISCCTLWKAVEFSYLTNMRYIFLLGLEASAQFLGNFNSFSSIYRTIFQASFFGKKVLIIPVYHPGFLIRRQDLLPEVIQYIAAIGEIIKLDKAGILDWKI